MLSKHQLQQTRTVKKLSQFVVKTFVRVSLKRSELHRAHLRKGLYKDFQDEIVPLAAFCRLKYPKKYLIQYVIGNQAFDAKVFDAQKQLVEKIEMTFPQLGRDAADDSKLVVTRGFGETRIYRPGDNLRSLLPVVARVAEKKSKKDYADCCLVFVISYLPPFACHTGLYQAHVDSIVRLLKQYSFKAKQVFLLDLPNKKLFEVTA